MRIVAFSKKVTERFIDTTRQSLALTLEAGASVLTYELYPLGVLPGSVRTIPCLWATKQAAMTPVLFVHGVFHNPATFTCIKQRLTWAGWKRFHEINLLHSIKSIPNNAGRISREVDRLRRKYRVPHVDIIAHSMGGILARYYIQRLGGDGKVRHLVTLGTPHHGTKLSKYSIFPYLRELAPKSRTMRILHETPLPTKTQMTAISGELDVFTRQQEAGTLAGVRQFELSSVGHAGILFSRRATQIILATLSGESIDQVF